MTPQVEVSNLITPLLNAYKAVSSELDNFFEIGLTEYLHSQTEKYYFTNTFLHRSEKVKFDNIYFPIKATYKELTTDFENLEEVLSEYKNITIIGSAGSGKTTLIKFIFLNAIRKFKQIPILIELRNLNDYDGDFEKLITEKVLKSKIKPNDVTFKRTLESGNFLFLLDGYDEIFSEKKQEINRQIELFVDSFSANSFLITTRPGSGIESFPRFHDFKVRSLDDDDVQGFISKIVEEGERKDRIVNIIKDPKNENYFEYLRNPLLLSMFIMAFENHPEIPSRKSAFYRNVFDTLYSRHDGITKNSFPREKLTKLQRDDFEYILCIFSYLTLMEGQYSFTQEVLTDVLGKVKKTAEYDFVVENMIYDLQTSISILILDGFEYYFPHRSMQEYFTALFISKLPTDRKETAYSNLSDVLEMSSTDNSFNFWSLCNELDEHVFASSFLIPSLKKISEALENKKGLELLETYSRLVGAVLIPFDHQSGDNKLWIFRSSSPRNAVLDFCEVYDYKDFWMFPETSGCENRLRLIFEKEKDKDRKALELYSSEKLMKFLLENNINDVIDKFKVAINNKIQNWESELNRKKGNIDDLLKK